MATLPFKTSNRTRSLPQSKSTMKLTSSVTGIYPFGYPDPQLLLHLRHHNATLVKSGEHEQDGQRYARQIAGIAVEHLKKEVLGRWD